MPEESLENINFIFGKTPAASSGSLWKKTRTN